MRLAFLSMLYFVRAMLWIRKLAHLPMHFDEKEEERKTVINSTSNYLSSETVFPIIWNSISVLWCCHRTFSNYRVLLLYVKIDGKFIDRASQEEWVLNCGETRSEISTPLTQNRVYKKYNANFSSCPSHIYRPLPAMHKNNEVVRHEISHRNKLVLGMHVRTYLSFHLFIHRKQFWTFIIFVEASVGIWVISLTWLAAERAHKCTDCWAHSTCRTISCEATSLSQFTCISCTILLYFRRNYYIVVIVLMLVGCRAIRWALQWLVALYCFTYSNRYVWLMAVANAQAHAAVTFYFQALIT